MIGGLALWFAGTLLAACALTPLLHVGLGELLDPSPWAYSKLFSRVLLAAAVLLLVLLRRRMDFAPLRTTWGREGWYQRLYRLLLGVLLALGPALLFLPLVVAGGEVRWSPDPPAELALRVGKSLPGAVLGSLAEEAFFRGIVFLGLAHALLRRGTPRASVLAALASSLVYAWLHFLAPPDDFELGAWSPLVGFEFFGLVLERYVEPVRAAAMLGLFLVGYSLCRCLARSGSFGLCVGLHAGWFLAAKAGVHLLQLVQPPAGDIGQAKRLLFLGQPWTWLAIASTVVLVEILLRCMPALVGATESEVASTATG